ncbi:T9SS type A sorting domain-containing protein [Dyadobacter endophyticus]|uniref:Secretion system C-terminal sorting domain-containing protein n=1 Tax=Dyadobacter endophyticus TaxID=1749036 RepID=A0ABQ1YL89_9BACT|nr:T9SS type A sorting domain-containing protein [Dyadobacter endophyticus]GGH28696.1 hypothetical protein GCM10007423_15470 [Dyadobacter endophyticus]
MRKTLFIYSLFLLSSLIASAQSIQGTLKYGSSSGNGIITLKNNGVTSYTGNITSFSIVVSSGAIFDFHFLSDLHYTFSSNPVSYTTKDSFGYHYYQFDWTGSLAVNLLPGATLDLITFKLDNSFGSSNPGVVTLWAGTDRSFPWSVKVNTIEAADPVDRFYSSGIAGSFLTNAPEYSFYEIPFLAAPLPVQLADFKAKKEEHAVKLTWITAEEINSRNFEIQHSADSKIWRKVGSVDASGESKQRLDYAFIHQSPEAGDNYYRLKMIDADETFSYSKINHVRLADIAGVYPNPASDVVYFRRGSESLLQNVELYDGSGRIVLKKRTDAGHIDVSSFVPGVYALKLTGNNGAIRNHKIIIGR